MSSTLLVSNSTPESQTMASGYVAGGWGGDQNCVIVSYRLWKDGQDALMESGQCPVVGNGLNVSQ